MHYQRSLAWLFPFFGAVAIAAGCKSVVEIDVDCPKLCLASAGPTLPGLASLTSPNVDGAAYAPLALDAGAGLALPDAGILQGSVTWEATMKFNDVLAQLPSAAVDVSVDVRLTSVSLTSTIDLSFIKSMRVSLSREQDALGRGSTTRDQVADAGGGDAVAGDSGCREAGSSILVASYDNLAGGTSGAIIDLVNVVPEMNLFDCIKDTPAKFSVTMAFQAGSYPATDAPLPLSTCIGAQSHVSYP
jgi:hypothetical protein